MDFPEGTLTIGSDLKVRRLGFGAMRLTGRGIWGPPANEEEALRVLRRAIELGVNFIDTADSYGPEVSERLIAKALHPYPGGLVIATKGGLERPSPGQWRPNCKPAHLKEACEGSLQRLKLDRIDLYQLHTHDPRVPLEDSIGALAELRAAGKIRHIGVSNFSVSELKRAQKIAPIVSVQNMYNMSDRKSDPVLDRCAADGLGFLPYFPLAASVISLAAVHASMRSRNAIRRHRVRLRSHGCSSARPRCCRFQEHRRSPIWRRTSGQPRSSSATTISVPSRTVSLPGSDLTPVRLCPKGKGLGQAALGVRSRGNVPMIRSRSSAAISASDMPRISLKTLRLCSPSSGAGRSATSGVSEKCSATPG